MNLECTSDVCTIYPIVYFRNSIKQLRPNKEVSYVPRIQARNMYVL